MLAKIIANQKFRLAETKKQIPLAVIMEKIDVLPSVISFKERILNSPGIAIIGEIKKTSPSKGVLQDNFNPRNLALTYIKNDIAAISILTEEKMFQGNNKYLQEIRQISPLPLLRKDFIIDAYQIYEARYLGADAVLLIAGILTDKQLKESLQICSELGLAALVETHTQEGIANALTAGAEIIGINNRDLKTFNVSLENSFNLIKYIPSEVIAISESGINSYLDIIKLGNYGFKAALIGEAFMTAANLTDKILELKG